MEQELIGASTRTMPAIRTGPVELGPATQFPARPNGSRHPDLTLIRVRLHY